MKLNRSMQASLITVVFFSAFIFLLTACAGGKGAQKDDAQSKPEQQKEEKVLPDPPLAKKYTQVVVFDFDTTPQIKKDYPDAVKECQASAITGLQMKNAFKSVAPHQAGKKYPEGTLLVKALIKDMRLVSTGARIWAGAWAGSSYITMDVQLIDAGSGKEVRKKELNSATNAWAAAWTSGSSDRSLPADMGRVVAEYIMSIMP